jgi:thiosulfate dehydrogenase [quinone] large subunit
MLMSDGAASFSTAQKIALVVLRTLIGWHFLYEGYYKFALPAWSPGGEPLGRWTAAGFIRAAKGPIGRAFQQMLDWGLGGWIDRLVIGGLILAGLSLILGLFTRIGCWIAMLLLAMFYLAAIPLSGVPESGGEGTYLLVNKNLIELAAVWLILVMRTERIAGLDLLWSRKPKPVATSPTSES